MACIVTAVERLQAAIDKLDMLAVDTVDKGQVSKETLLVALSMIIPVRRILAKDVALIKASEGDVLDRVLRAAERAGDLALADAILEGAS